MRNTGKIKHCIMCEFYAISLEIKEVYINFVV